MKASFFCLLTFLFLVSSPVAEAQSCNPKPNYSGPKLYHFLMDRSLLLRQYRDNSRMLDALDSLFNDPGLSTCIDSVLITGAASPIALSAYNDSLSRKRAAAVESYIMWKHPEFDRSKIHASFSGVDWEGFLALVNSDNDLPARRQIKDLLSYNLPKDVLLERLRTVGGRAAFDYLVKNIYPQLQYVSVRIHLTDGNYIPPEASSPLRTVIEKTVVDTIITIIHDTVYVSVKTPALPVENTDTIVVPEKKGSVLGVKTNLLYDLALLPNLSIELPLGRYWSLVAEANWSWWSFNASEGVGGDYHRIQAGGFELRRWFASPEKLRGHALGLYALGGTYDVRMFTKGSNETGWLSNWSYSCGLSYAYSWSITSRLNLELGIAAGYLGGRYYEYEFHVNTEHKQWEWKTIRNRNYFGLTRFGISLVWELKFN